MDKQFRVFATCDIGEAIDVLRKRGYEVDVYPHPEAPPKSIIVSKVRSGIDALITTLRDQIDAEVFEAGKGSLKVVAQIAVGFDNLQRSLPCLKDFRIDLVHNLQRSLPCLKDFRIEG